ncbi:S9 family peptidase [Runella salmonicolor]|uniref:S9 family peptidase n=1 Tax=Runella salmonicolor TaxID=2950278 RepID=A0ABT1FN68_9BACT|nr:S9 family peptidase [Runella salmonicolor]MCP1383182.1 S9 family peptidase [Runella salmonicolor]
MKTIKMAFGFYVLLFFCISACKTSPEQTKVFTQADFPAPPKAPKKPQIFTNHGYQRSDDYFWLKDKSNPETIAYLKAENAYADTVMASTKGLQKTLFEEMKGRIKEEDQSVPSLDNGYYYYSRQEKGKQYSINCRKKGSLDAPEEIILDQNKMAKGKPAFIFGGFEISDDNNIMAYVSNTTGSYAEYELKFKDLRTGKELPDKIARMAGGITWAADNKTVFYNVPNAALRSHRIYKHVLGNPSDALVYEEKDELFNAYVGRSKTKKMIAIYATSFTSSEAYLLPADRPNDAFKSFLPRQKDIQYGIDDYPDRYFITWKDPQNKNQKVYEAPKQGYEDRSKWKEIIAHDPQAKIEGIEVFEKYMVVTKRVNGLLEMNVREIASGTTKTVNFPEPVYTAYSNGTPEFTSTKFRYSYTSLNRPTTIYDYDMVTNQATKLKEREVPSGFNADDYEVKRLWAVAKDGVKVPLSIVYKKGMELNGSNPCLLYSYGSYGYSTDANFNANVFSLVNRGFVYAIAHIRGGSDLGEQWYEDGKLQKKMNTFTDFVACAEHLIKEKYTSSSKLAINGGSAGGLLMGAVTNLRPDLFRVVVAEVPFVDVINTMLDSSLPLTTQEYEQWGNPNVKKDYDYMMTYSPYDNLKKANYPAILATGGLNDSQVGFHEPAKWVAKLRDLKTDNNILLLKINMDSGHGGATGRFDYLKEEAFNFAFILSQMGISN